MMIYIDLTPADFISLYGLGFLSTLFFLISGIMMVVTKNPNLISKNENYKNEKTFVSLTGWINIVFSSIMTIILVIAIINPKLNLTLFLVLGILAVTLLIIQFMLQTKFRIGKKKK